MRRNSKSRNPIVIQPSQQQPAAKVPNRKVKSNSNSPSSPSTPATATDLLVRIQVPDGNFASISIWIPLSIMASAAAKNAGQSEIISQTVANAVIGHGNNLTYRCKQKNAPAVDILTEVALASKVASNALLKAGGSAYAAEAVKEAVQGGGALLIPSLNSTEAIKLDKKTQSLKSKQSRNDRNTSGRNRDDNEQRDDPGIYNVNSEHEGSKKQVSWCMNTYTTSQHGDDLSGREIFLDSKSENKVVNKTIGKSSTPKVQRSRFHRSKSPPRNPATTSTQPNSTATETPISVEYHKNNGLCAHGLIEVDEKDGMHRNLDYSESSGIGGRGCVMNDVADEIQTETLQPDNLLPHWESRTLATYGTMTTNKSKSTMAPLLNLYLPVPGVERRDVGGTSSRFADDSIADGTLQPDANGGNGFLRNLFLPVEDHEDSAEGSGDPSNSLMSIQDSWTQPSTHTGTVETATRDHNNKARHVSRYQGYDDKGPSQGGNSDTLTSGRTISLPGTAMDLSAMLDHSEENESAANDDGVLHITSLLDGTSTVRSDGTHTLLSMKSKTCGWRQCDGLECPMSYIDAKKPISYIDVKNIENVNSDDSSTVFAWPLKTPKMVEFDTMTQTLDFVPEHEMVSRWKKVKLALGKLNCGAKKSQKRRKQSDKQINLSMK